MPTPYDDVLQAIEADSRDRERRVLGILAEHGSPALVAEFQANMQDVRNGVWGARSVWHSISPAQRKVLLLLAEGRWLARSPSSRTMYCAKGEPHALGSVCSIRTARALCAHELLACDGTTFDPEARFVLTERARFVIAHGKPE